MKKLYFLTTILILFISLQGFSQLDNSKNGGKKKGTKSLSLLSTPAKTIEKPKSLNSNPDFKSAYQKEQEKIKKQNRRNSFKNKGIISKEKLAEERFLKSFKKINGQYQYPVIDQDLGSIRTNSKSVKIICRDFQYPDGDKVTILVNEIPVIENITLRQSYQAFSIHLEVGVNKIAFKALNQGTSGPNTAAFKVYNDAGMLLSSNEWNLATGAKATLVVAKDK